MKITKSQLRKIIQEELKVIKELGPVTGHEEGTNAVDVVKEIGDSLIEVGKLMQGLPSTRAASEFGGFIESLGKESLEAHAELAAEGHGDSPRYETSAEDDLAKFQKDRFGGK